MANEENLKPFKKGQIGNPAGRPKGSKNRSTIFKEMLSYSADKIFSKNTIDVLEKQYPNIKSMNIQEIMASAQIMKSIIDQDTNSFKAVFDSAYGTPKQTVETIDASLVKPPSIIFEEPDNKESE